MPQARKAFGCRGTSVPVNLRLKQNGAAHE